jgi:hypothetical protein
MTLLAAVLDGDTVWIAQDTRHISMSNSCPYDQYGTEIDKSYHEHDTLVWAWYGDAPNGWQLFTDWMASAADTFTSWGDLQKRCQDKMDELKLYPFGILCAGVIGGKVGARHVGRDEYALVLSDDAIFVAFCRMSAATA